MIFLISDLPDDSAVMYCQISNPPERIRTLVVDDSEVARNTISGLLQSCGRLELVGTAADGREAIEKTRELNPHLIFMDLQMPVMNGFESASQIRKECPLARIVHMTTHDSPEVKEASLASGADHFLTKTKLPREFCRVFCDLFGACQLHTA